MNRGNSQARKYNHQQTLDPTGSMETQLEQDNSSKSDCHC